MQPLVEVTELTLEPLTFYYKVYIASYSKTTPDFMALLGAKGQELLKQDPTARVISFHFDSPTTLQDPNQCRSYFGIGISQKSEELRAHCLSVGLQVTEFKTPCTIALTNYLAPSYPVIMELIGMLDAYIMSKFPTIAKYMDIDGLPWFVFKGKDTIAYGAPIGDTRQQYAICKEPAPMLNEAAKADLAKRLAERPKPSP